MPFRRYLAILPFAILLPGAATMAAPLAPWNETKVIAEATGGQLKAAKGTYFDKDCNEALDYEAEAVDLNGDGQPEVFTVVHGTCLGGWAGNSVNLFIKNADGQWKPQFGFPGTYTVRKTRNKGFPDIEIGGPGLCFPVWRWNGERYAILKSCPSEGEGQRRRN